MAAALEAAARAVVDLEEVPAVAGLVAAITAAASTVVDFTARTIILRITAVGGLARVGITTVAADASAPCLRPYS